MAKPVKPSLSQPFVLGRTAFAKISAVEGLSLSAEGREMFDDFDRRDLTPVERRTAIAAKHSLSSPCPTRQVGTRKHISPPVELEGGAANRRRVREQS